MDFSPEDGIPWQKASSNLGLLYPELLVFMFCTVKSQKTMVYRLLAFCPVRQVLKYIVDTLRKPKESSHVYEKKRKGLFIWWSIYIVPPWAIECRVDTTMLQHTSSNSSPLSRKAMDCPSRARPWFSGATGIFFSFVPGIKILGMKIRRLWSHDWPRIHFE